MKKVISLVILLTLICSVFTSCNSSEKGIVATFKDKAGGIFGSSNTVTDVKGLSYRVPEDVTTEKDEDGDMYHELNNYDFIYVFTDEITEDDKVSSEKDRKAMCLKYIDNVVGWSDDYEKKNIKEVKIAGEIGFLCDYWDKTDDVESENRTLVFSSPEYIYTFTLSCRNENAFKKSAKVFDKLTNSIKLT